MNINIDRIKKELGNTIRDIRKKKGLTQEQLGDVADLSFKYIGEIERGEVNVSLHSMAKLAKALGITIGDLFSKSNQPLKIISKSPLSKLSSKDIKDIKSTLKLLDKTFSKV